MQTVIEQPPGLDFRAGADRLVRVITRLIGAAFPGYSPIRFKMKSPFSPARD
jgi:hypothetical protein